METIVILWYNIALYRKYCKILSDIAEIRHYIKIGQNTYFVSFYSNFIRVSTTKFY